MRHLRTPRRRKIARMASAGITEQQIAALFGILLATLQFFFPRELQIGAIVAALRFRSKAKPEPQPSNKSSFMSQPPPFGSLIVCGPDGQEVAF